MATPAKHATIYLDSIVHKTLKLKAVETSRSVFDLENEAVSEGLTEDIEALAAFDEWSKETPAQL